MTIVINDYIYNYVMTDRPAGHSASKGKNT